jgi:hypothetical protein
MNKRNLKRMSQNLCIVLVVFLFYAPSVQGEDITVTTYYPGSDGGGSLGETGDTPLAQDEDSHVHIGEAVHLSGNNYEAKLWLAGDSTRIDTVATPTGDIVPDIVLQNTHDTDNNYNRILFVNSVGGVDSAIVGVHGDAAATGSDRQGQLKFLTANAAGLTTRMVLDNMGYVGIGTLTPKAYLHTKNTAIYTFGEDDYTTDSLALYGAVANNSGKYYGGITWHNDDRRRAGIASVMESADANHVGLAFFTQGVDGPGGISESLRIAHNGYVGIGTKTPTSQLTIGSETVDNLEIIAPNPTIRSSSSDRCCREAFLEYDASVDALILDVPDSYASFILQTRGAYNTRFRINGKGNAHIGTSIPATYDLLWITATFSGIDGLTDKYGIHQQMYGNATGANYAIYNNTGGVGILNYLQGGTGNKIGTYNYLTGGSVVSTGSYNRLTNSTVNNTVGIGASVSSSTSTSTNYGMHSVVSGLSNEKYGLYSIVQGEISTTNYHYGLRVTTSGGGSLSTNYGIYAKALDGGSGKMVGVYSEATDKDYDAYNGTYHSISSKRWKEDVITIANALDKTLALRGVAFDWDESHGGKHTLGFIAEEVGEVLPEIVSYEQGGSKHARSMDYSKVSAVLVEAIKEQRAMLQTQDQMLKAQDLIIQRIESEQESLIQELEELQ